MKIRNNNSRQIVLKLKNGDSIVIPPYAIVEVDDGLELPSGVYVIESKPVSSKKDGGKEK